MLVTKEFQFCAAHRLLDYAGACANLHGHNYKVHVTLMGEPGANGMVVDFKEIKRVVGRLIDTLDHNILINNRDQALIDFVNKEYEAGRLNKTPMVLNSDPTAEYIAELIKEYATVNLPDHEVYGVKVWETDTCYAEAV